MSDIFTWKDLSQEDKQIILEFVTKNNSSVREKMRNEFPHLYIGRAPEEVAKGWLVIAGLEAVKKHINSNNNE